MNSTVRKYLIESARKRTYQTVTYQRLCDDCRLKLEMKNPDHRNQIAKILEEVSCYEFRSEPSRPLLSSLVLRLNDNLEGDGFYKLGEKLGFGNWPTLKRGGVFEMLQIKQCIIFWQNDTNYEKFK